MGFFSSKPKPFFDQDEQARIIAAIRSCETSTSGEIRVYVEGKNEYVSPLDRAREIFFKLEMEHTEHRNGVLLYIAIKHKEVALFGDEGIYKATGADYWNNEVREMLMHFKDAHIVDGIVNCIHHVGNTLKEKFPYIPGEDRNELPDEIVFGR